MEGEFLRENGRVKVRLEPTFSSTPPLSQAEVYALLAKGEIQDASTALTLFYAEPHLKRLGLL